MIFTSVHDWNGVGSMHMINTLELTRICPSLFQSQKRSHVPLHPRTRCSETCRVQQFLGDGHSVGFAIFIIHEGDGRTETDSGVALRHTAVKGTILERCESVLFRFSSRVVHQPGHLWHLTKSCFPHRGSLVQVWLGQHGGRRD